MYTVQITIVTYMYKHVHALKTVHACASSAHCRHEVHKLKIDMYM